MLKRFVLLAAIFLGIAAVAIPSFAQDPAQRPSPSAKANCSFSDGKSVNVDYSSPRAKGRKIYGGLVPYGEVWRGGGKEGANLFTPRGGVGGGGARGGGQLHDVCDSEQGQVDADHQQEDGRVGYSLPRCGPRSGARGHEGFELAG